MPDEDNEPEDGKKQKGLFGNWVKDDTKLLAITIIGTITANIITVVIVGLAVIIARWWRPSVPTTGDYVFLWAFPIFPLLVLYMLYPGWREGRRYSKLVNFLSILTGVMAVFIILMTVLAAIGLAVGVK